MSNKKQQDIYQNIEYIPKNRKIQGGQKMNMLNDCSRYVRWPKFINIQRQRRIFGNKIKLPGPLQIFSSSLDKNMTRQMFTLLKKYCKKPVKKNSKNENLDINTNNKFNLVHGTNSVCKFITKNEIFFVVIAQDVNPIECIVWLPSFCIKNEIPYCIVKGKSKLGELVGRKKVSCIALKADSSIENDELKKMRDCFYSNFNKRYLQAKQRWNL